MFVFPWVDSAQAHCVRACPVISAGLGRTSTNERQFLSFAASSPRLYLASYCARVCLWSRSYHHNAVHPFWMQYKSCRLRRAVKPGWGQGAMVPNRLSSGKQGGVGQPCKGRVRVSFPPVLLFVSSKCRISSHSRAFTCRSQTLLPIHFNA